MPAKNTATDNTNDQMAHALKLYQDEIRRLRALAYKDELTSLGNRRSFQTQLESQVRNAQHRGEEIALLCLDLDDLKVVNDTYGHPFGDLALRLAGKAIAGTIARGMFAARIGGDEFAIIARDISRPDALALGKALQGAIRAIRLEDMRLSCSVGIAHTGLTSFIDTAAPHLLYWAADEALYSAKHRGKGQIHFDG